MDLAPTAYHPLGPLYIPALVVVRWPISHSFPLRFNGLVDQLAQGDASLYREIREDLCEIPAALTIGDLYIAVSGTRPVWYEILALPHDGRVSVRLFSWAFKSGDYDYVALDSLAARVRPRLFRRAQTNGFRTVHALN